MAELRWTSEAQLSLRDIYDYIARDRPTTARRTLESLLIRVESLSDFPTLGHPYPYRSDRHLRILTHGQFQVAYLVEDDDRVSILGIFHGLIFLPLK